MNTRVLMGGSVERRVSLHGGAGAAVGLWTILLGLTIMLSAVPARAATSEFVGILAMVVEDEVARELQLSDEQKSQLLDLIDQREEAAVDLALELRDLSPAEQESRLKPFREESERLGLALLTSQQRRTLERIRIRRLGLAALAEPKVADELALTPEQQTQVAQLLEQRARRLAEADEGSLQQVRAEMERRLAAVLTEHQRAAWELLTDRRLPKSFAPGATTARTEPAETGPAGEGETSQPGQPQQPTSEAPAMGEAALAGAASESEQPAAAKQPGETIAGSETFPGSEEAAPAEAAGAGVAEGEAPPTASESAKAEPQLRFEFHYQPWKDVLEWFARQADLSLVMEAPPPGTFNYTDERSYTPAEAIDLLNSILLTKGYTLVRRERMLMLINLEDGIPPNLVSTIRPEELDQRGEYELVRVLFDLNTVTAEEAEAEIKKLLGPQGTVVPLPKSRQILVTETAGRLRAIRALIQRIEDPRGITSGQIRSFELKHVTPDEVLAVARQLLEIPEDAYAAEDGSIRLAVDTLGNRLLATGRPDKLTRLEEVIRMVDVPLPGGAGEGLAVEAPQLEVYSVGEADPESVLAVMQTLMAGLPDVRLAIDPKTGNLVALARPSEHATIRATLEQMQRDARQVEVIPLRVVDPQLAVLAINKLFGISGEEKEKAPNNAPQVDADPTRRQLLVRATRSQIEQIRTLLEKMGESESAAAVSASEKGNVRMLPVTGPTAQAALEQLQQIWPALRRNPIRVVTPSAVIPSYRPGSGGLPAGSPVPAAGPPSGSSLREKLSPAGGHEPESHEPERLSPAVPPAPVAPSAVPEEESSGQGSSPGPAESPPATQPPEQTAPQTAPPFPPAPSSLLEQGNPTAGSRSGPRVIFVGQAVPESQPASEIPPAGPRAATPLEEAAAAARSAAETPEEKSAPAVIEPEEARPDDSSTEPTPAAAPSDAPPDGQPEPTDADGPQTRPPDSQPAPSVTPRAEPAPIIVSIGPGGVMIASDDLEALDQFEQLFNELASGALGATGELTVFYLKHAKASLVAETLDQIFGGGTLTQPSESSEGGGGRSMMSEMANAALGDVGGGIIGALLGMGEEGTITPSGTIRITPDNRLNALIVQANPADLATIEELLKVLDQKESPEEVLVVPKVKVIPVFNTQAQEIANVLKEVYQDRMVTSSQSSSGGRPPSPQEIFMMLRNRGGSSRGRGSRASEEVERLAVSVDTRTNSLVIAAPEPLFTEVQQVIEQLDQAAVETNQAVRVITLHHSSPEAVRRAISAATGENIQFGSGSSRSSSYRSSSGSRSSSSSSRYPSSSSSRYGSSSRGYRPPFGGYRPPGR